MPNIEISQAAYDKLAFGAKIAGVPLKQAVDRLVGVESTDPAALAPRLAAVPSPTNGAEMGVHVTYRGHRIRGVLNLDTERLRITEAPDGALVREYGSPSNAAMEVVRVLNPDRKRPETNGWRFWLSDRDDQIIDTHRRRRA